MNTIERQKILAEISGHEASLVSLRKLLPPTLLKFFKFRCLPPQDRWVYAKDLNTAQCEFREWVSVNLAEKVDGILSVDEFSPYEAAEVCESNLLDMLSPGDARRFSHDFRGEYADPGLGVSKPKLVRDFESWANRH